MFLNLPVRGGGRRNHRTTAKQERRRIGSIALSAVMMFGTVTAIAVVGSASPAQAAPNLACGSVYSIQGSGDRAVRLVNPDTGATTDVGNFTIPGATANLNGLAISDGGSAAYGVLPANTGTARSIYAYDRASDTTTRLGAGVDGTPVTHGAINPQNGIYYYGGISSASNGRGTLNVYGFNTQTNQSIGMVATGTIPAGGGNGDWVFDQQGKLYVVGGNPGNNIVSAVDQKIPTAGPAITITASAIITTDAAAAINGIAFGDDPGFLYISSSTKIFRVNPSTGEVVLDNDLGNGSTGSVDLASCAYPNTISVQKDFSNGRVNPTDQATMTVTGGGVTANNTGTTAGTDTGLQDQPAEIAGPVFGLAGNTYTIEESGTGTGTPSYLRSWECVDLNANGRVLASGDGTSGQFTIPNSQGMGVAAECTFTNVAQIPAISLDKQAGSPSGNTRGSTIPYTFVVTNTGNVALATTTISDPKLGAVTCPDGDLAPGASKTCTAPDYELTQEDVDAGTVDNDATVTGTPTTPGLPTVTDDDDTTTPIEQTSTLVIDKRAGDPVDVNENGITDAGDTIAYSFTVSNPGNVTISNVEVVDPLVGDVTCEETTLAPGAETECEGDDVYTITEADKEAESVDNVASAIGDDPQGEPVVSEEDTTTTPVQTPDPQLAIDKRAGDVVDVNENDVTDAGDTIAYDFTVSNPGNVTIKNIKVVDPLVGAVTCEQTTLPAGESTECEADAPYVLTQDDVDAGTVDNTATATGNDPDGDPVDPPEDSTNTPIEQTPTLTIDKRAGDPVDVNESGITDAGDTIAYEFTVSNTGNVTITNVGVVDPLVGDVTCAETTLAPGAETECEGDAVYTITEADEEAETVDNVATATGQDPQNGPVESEEDTTTTPVQTPDPQLAIDKRAGDLVDVNDNDATDEGDTIAYTFTVSNTGNVTISTIEVIDPLVGDVTCEETTLLAGASTECKADEPYALTQDDVDAGTVDNTATATGNDPDGDPVDPPEDSTNTPIEQTPKLDLVKNAKLLDEDGDDKADVGEKIEWTFTVTNTGNLTLDALSVSDPMAGGITCDETTLAPGDSTECAADDAYVVAQGDVERGNVRNVATSTGTTPDDRNVDSPPSETNTPTDTRPGLSLKKTSKLVDQDGDDKADPDEKIRYTFAVQNTGTTAIDNLSINDPMLIDAAVKVVCEQTALAPAATTTCTADYIVTKADIKKGAVVNQATATGCTADPLNNDDGDTCVRVTSDPDDAQTPVDVPKDSVDIAPPAAPENPKGPGGILPDAGGPVVQLLVAALALLGAGSALIWGSRRRRTTNS